jgi:hypothetical protein
MCGLMACIECNKSSLTKNYEFRICYFFTKDTASRSIGKDRLSRNHDNVSESSDMSYRGILWK